MGDDELSSAEAGSQYTLDQPNFDHTLINIAAVRSEGSLPPPAQGLVDQPLFDHQRVLFAAEGPSVVQSPPRAFLEAAAPSEHAAALALVPRRPNADKPTKPRWSAASSEAHSDGDGADDSGLANMGLEEKATLIQALLRLALQAQGRNDSNELARLQQAIELVINAGEGEA